MVVCFFLIFLLLDNSRESQYSNNHLQMRKVCTSLVPKSLTEEYVVIASELLEKMQNKAGEVDILYNIITNDEEQAWKLSTKILSGTPWSPFIPRRQNWKMKTMIISLPWHQGCGAQGQSCYLLHESAWENSHPRKMEITTAIQALVREFLAKHN